MTSYEEAITTIYFLAGIPGNATVYINLIENTDAIKWDISQWEWARVFYNNSTEYPNDAWLWDIYKNKCQYDIERTYNILVNYIS
jgi:fibrillarin-like rRNA methylase